MLRRRLICPVSRANGVGGTEISASLELRRWLRTSPRVMVASFAAIIARRLHADACEQRSDGSDLRLCRDGLDEEIDDGRKQQRDDHNAHAHWTLLEGRN